MTPLQIIGTISIVIGCVFALTGSVGVLRMPDFYSRLHPAGKSDTLAQGLILLGLAFFAGEHLLDVFTAEHAAHAGEHHGPPAWIGPLNVILKLVLLSALLFLTAPTATHAIAKAARLDIHTKLSVEGDPNMAAQSQVSEIIVMGDTREKLAEAPNRVLDVHDAAGPDAGPDAAAGDEADARTDDPDEPDSSDEPGDENNPEKDPEP